ncbi:hypothetical protein C8R44DRAFT_741735 [Mycena epipterygia]|nr:hypothetical protein C8R44DRAFT_741735 [Mycena epipterygia]
MDGLVRGMLGPIFSKVAHDLKDTRSARQELWFKPDIEEGPGTVKVLLSDLKRNKPFKNIKTPRADFMRMLKTSYLDPVMHDALTWKDDKATDFAFPALCIARVIQAIEDVDIAQFHVPNVNAWLRQGNPIPALTAECVKHTLFRDLASLTSIEFIGIAILIEVQKHSRSLSGMVRMIETLRKDVVKHEMWFGHIFKAVIEFIHGDEGSD